MAEMAKEMANSVETLPSVSYRIQRQNRLYSERGKAGRNVEQAKAFRAAEQLRNRQSKTRKKEETPAAPPPSAQPTAVDVAVAVRQHKQKQRQRLVL